jgi:hypothetical protein
MTYAEILRRKIGEKCDLKRANDIKWEIAFNRRACTAEIVDVGDDFISLDIGKTTYVIPLADTFLSDQS